MCAFCSSSLFTNSNWFTFDGDRGINDRLAASVPSSSPNSEEISLNAEETDEVLTGETTGTESLPESASLGNGPVEEAKELSEVANDSDATTVSEKILCTEEDSASHEPETSERPVDAQEGQTGGAAEASSTEGAANEPCSSLKTCATLCSNTWFLFSCKSCVMQTTNNHVLACVKTHGFFSVINCVFCN